MSARIHVLCVDDDPSVRDFLATALERTNDEFDVTTADSGRAGLAILDDVDIDCLISDYEMPGMNGLEFFEAVRDRDPDVPFLLVTGADPGEIARKAIDAGVTDYLRKGTATAQYTVLAHRIENAVEKRRVEARRAAVDRQLERYRSIVENAADPICLFDRNGTITMVNDAAVDWLGDDRERLLGSTIETFLADETAAGASDAPDPVTTAAPPERSRFECTFETEDGRRAGEMSVAPLEIDDEPAGSIGIVRELTRHGERRRERYRDETILETAPFGLFVLDADGTIVWLNDEYLSEFEESEDELLGMAFPTLIERGYYRESTIDQYIEAVRQLLSADTDGKATYKVRFRRPDGDERIYDVHTKLLPLEDGEFAGTVHAFRDITRQERYRRELERQNDRLEQFASLVSHDLRNPLNVAQGHLDPLEEQLDSRHVDELQWSLSRMAELVDGLLQLARQGKTIGEREWLPLAGVARDAWSTVDTGDARLEIDGEMRVYGDDARLRTLFENLFRNSVKHGTDETEPLVVTVGPLAADGESTGDETSRHGFSVEDTGVGLPADTDSLFEFGYTTKPDGTGFGLAIVAEIAEAHGWSVTARNGSAGGARFEITNVTTSDADVGSIPDESDAGTDGSG
ncbi:hybrid sensor histidine kinase/response regulator [Natrinema longum]|uniref:histidine kinase n=1 Tax=Natrinema longum TaxID=370324 RepID=A0A8A2UCW4_9EURY|nr:PAS domain S-box protein [Natrinema longum]MBZ6495575.1 PAS domain S-box protein [Natrinema longum]QSW86460.1 PAS domain S-box protein [Natrinema longum]